MGPFRAAARDPHLLALSSPRCPPPSSWATRGRGRGPAQPLQPPTTTSYLSPRRPFGRTRGAQQPRVCRWSGGAGDAVARTAAPRGREEEAARTSLIAAAAARRRRWRRELTVPPQHQASCPPRGGALKSQARPPPLPASPGAAEGRPSPVPAPQLLSADPNFQHSLPDGSLQRGTCLVSPPPCLPRSTCSLGIAASEVKRGFPPLLPTPHPLLYLLQPGDLRPDPDSLPQVLTAS